MMNGRVYVSLPLSSFKATSEILDGAHEWRKAHECLLGTKAATYSTTVRNVVCNRSSQAD